MTKAVATAPGKMRALIRAYDWLATPLGAMQSWPQSLKTVVDLVLANRFPIALGWGPDLTCIYNDAYRPLLGTKPDALGRPFLEVWPEVRAALAPIIESALAGETSYFENRPFTITRYGYPEESYFTCCFSPVRDETGANAGVLITALETTKQVATNQAREARLAQLAAVVEQSRDFIGIAGTDGTPLYVNDAGLRLMGLPDQDAACAVHFTEYFAQRDRPVVRDEALPACERDGYWEGELTFRRFDDGRELAVLYNIFPVRTAEGRTIAYATVTRDLTEKKRARAQERLTQALSAAGMVGTFDWHVQSDTCYSDARLAEMFSVDPANGEKGAPLAEYLAGIHPEDVERIANAINHTVTTRERYAQEYRLVQKDRSTRWVEAHGECLYDENGKPDRFVGVVVDITSQKNAQERQRLLAREADHRVKNIFANFHSVIALSARSARTPQEMAQALNGRMDALLRAKDLVQPGILGTEHESQRTTVGALVRTVLQPYEDGSPNRIVLSGPAVPVGAKAVTGLALALHETATNAVKYGALSRPNGSIRVTWDANHDVFNLEWDETGGPVIEVTPLARGFGSILTERSVSSELGGKIEYDWRRTGLRLKLSVPLKRLAV